MSQLSSYPNVYNTCLILLERRGYKLRFERVGEDWFAERDGFVFRGDNPIELLGLSAIYEEIKPQHASDYWWKIDGPDIFSRLDPES